MIVERILLLAPAPGAGGHSFLLCFAAMSTPSPSDAKIGVTHAGLLIDGQAVPLLAGALHYFRIPKAHWRDALLGMRDLGLRFVDIYTPWAVHETEPGQYDFGQQDERKDLAALLSLADSLEMRVILRPGPHINAELTRFGIPQWIVDDEACIALGPGGEPVPLLAPPRGFAVPSYASHKFRDHVQHWFSTLADVVRPYMYPAGPIALVQVDNEAAFYFRDSVYDQDYRQEALVAYEDFLKARYRTPQHYAEVHGTPIARWSDIEPPRHFEAQTRRQLVRHLDWVESQEHLLAKTLGEMATDLTAQGLAGPALTTHNIPMGDAGQPLGPGAFSRIVDLPGADFYERRSRLASVKRRTLRLTGSVALPFAAEAGVGGPPWLPARTEEDSLQVLLCGLAYGLRGFNLYMAVDRDRWYGAALDRRGERTSMGKRVGQLLSACRELSFFELRRRAPVGLIIPRTYQRLARATHTLGAISPALLDVSGIEAVAACRQDRFGFNYTIQQHFAAWLDAAAALLTQAQIPYVYVDSDAHPDRIAHLKTLLIPTYALGDAGACHLAQACVARGGTFICGPETPEFDARMQPLTWPTATCTVDLTQSHTHDQALAALTSISELDPGFRVTGADIERSVHEDQNGPKVLFLTNFHSHDGDARLRLPHPMRLLDVLSGVTYKGNTHVTITVPGYTCMMLRIRPARSERSTQERQGMHHAE